MRVDSFADPPALLRGFTNQRFAELPVAEEGGSCATSGQGRPASCKTSAMRSGDRAWRTGLRLEDLLDRPVLRSRLERLLPDKNLLLASMGADTFDLDLLVDTAVGWGERLAWKWKDRRDRAECPDSPPES